MKMLLVVGLLCLPFGVFAQQVKPKPKDNLILIQTPDSAAAALKKLAAAFVAQGYTVDKFDAQFLTLTLAPKTLDVKNSPALTAQASATAGPNSILRLSGQYKAFIGHIPANDVAQLGGSEAGLYSHTFRALEKVALAYPSGQVSYGKQ